MRTLIRRRFKSWAESCLRNYRKERTALSLREGPAGVWCRSSEPHRSGSGEGDTLGKRSLEQVAGFAHGLADDVGSPGQIVQESGRLSRP